ncbi:LysR family transcriptional regulator [Streptomyces sp. NPDC096311]|uniref:LysR family transcriptional regulator n=1 Tax=Streptomyces sp. NPDC096311 TaxID=3366083 RepID=UPI0038019F32
MDLDLRLVRYVVCIAEELHFGRAAGRLHITQQALSAQVGRLERRLGIALFIRDRRHVELTPAGALFVEHGRQLLSDADDLLSELADAVPAVRVDMVTEGLPLSTLVTHLRAQLPQVALEFTQHHGLTAAVPRLLATELDVAFGWVGGLQEPLPVPLEHQVVRRERLRLVVPKDHPLAGLTEVPLSRLAAHPIMLHTAKEAAEWERWNDALSAEFGLRIVERVHGHGKASTLAAIRAYGRPAVATLEMPVPEDLVVRPLVAPVPVYEWSMVWRSAHQTPAAIRVTNLIAEIAETLAWQAPPARAYWEPTAGHRRADQPDP